MFEYRGRLLDFFGCSRVGVYSLVVEWYGEGGRGRNLSLGKMERGMKRLGF